MSEVRPTSITPRRTSGVLGVAMIAMSLVACSDESAPPTAGPTPRQTVTPTRLEVADAIPQQGVPQIVGVTVADGEASGDTGIVEVRADSLVRLVVLVDALDVVEVEGYGLDIRTEVNRPVQEEFLATERGDFDVRLRESGLLLTRLRVQ